MEHIHGFRIGKALVIAMGCAVSTARAQTDTYPEMAASGGYLMEKDSEIQLARTAAPESISRDATILVLGRQGYETAVEGKNGFVCWGGRSWTAAFDWPEFWKPKVRAADCMNQQAARAIERIALLPRRLATDGGWRGSGGGRGGTTCAVAAGERRRRGCCRARTRWTG